MLRADLRRSWRACLGVIAFLCLTWLGTDVRASSSAAQGIRVTADSTSASWSGLIAADRTPCALCYGAPEPAVHGLSATCTKRPPLAWWTELPTATEATWQVATDSGGQGIVPIRIAFCRWLD